MKIKNEQLELTIQNANFCPSATRRGRRSRASLWFARMRQIVDAATDWTPTPPPRPIQTWFREATPIEASHQHTLSE